MMRAGESKAFATLVGFAIVGVVLAVWYLVNRFSTVSERVYAASKSQLTMAGLRAGQPASARPRAD